MDSCICPHYWVLCQTLFLEKLFSSFVTTGSREKCVIWSKPKGVLFSPERDQIPRQSEHGTPAPSLSARICPSPSSQLSLKNKHRYTESNSSCSTYLELANSQVTCPRSAGLDHSLAGGNARRPQHKVAASMPLTGMNRGGHTASLEPKDLVLFLCLGSGLGAVPLSSLF